MPSSLWRACRRCAIPSESDQRRLERVPCAAARTWGAKGPILSPMPRVTVCIPTYKRARWLARAIESALGQTFDDLVVEVHDDATPGDSVANVVDGFHDSR